MIDQLQH